MEIREKLETLLGKDKKISQIYGKVLKKEKNNLYKQRRKDVREEIKKIIEEEVSKNENR